MATYQTYQQVGIKEDVSDIISNLSPTKTPFQSGIGSEKVTNTLFQWQEDSLRAVNSAPAVQGADAVDITVVPTVMRNNETQIFVEAVKVAGTTDAVSTYGRKRESAYQMAKSAAQLKRDREHALVGTAQDKAAGSASVPGQMAGFQMQVASAAVFHAGVSTALGEPLLLTALQTCYDNGAEPTRIQVTPANSVVVAGFASAAGRYRTFQNGSAGDKSIVNVVNLYVSPFGEQKVELNRFLKTGNTLIFEPDMWTNATLRPWTRETLAKTGDATKQMLIGEFSLKHKNQLASAVIVDNLASGF